MDYSSFGSQPKSATNWISFFCSKTIAGVLHKKKKKNPKEIFTQYLFHKLTSIPKTSFKFCQRTINLQVRLAECQYNIVYLYIKKKCFLILAEVNLCYSQGVNYYYYYYYYFYFRGGISRSCPWQIDHPLAPPILLPGL